MKRILVILLVLILSLSVVACANSKTPTENNNSQSSNSSAAESKVENTDTGSGNADSSTTNIQNFTSIVESTLTMSDYNKKVSNQGNGQKVSYTKKANDVKPDFNVTVDGYSFKMPVKYTDLIQAGWKDTKELAEETLDKNSITSTTFTTSAGKSIDFSFVNKGNDSVKIKDTEAVKMEIKNASTNKTAKIDPPTFTILDKVSNSTDIKGILQAAAPANAIITDYNDSKTAVMSNINYKNGDDNIEITYYVDNNIIETVKMECGIAGSIITY